MFSRQNYKNYSKKVWKNLEDKKKSVSLQPVWEITDKKLIEKTEEKYKKQVPRKIQFIEKR